MASPEVVIAVLGPVDVRGAAQPFTRQASRDLVVYLAFHRGNLSHEMCAAALWPHRSVAPSTVHSTASDARRALGRSSAGSDHLPRQGRCLQLGGSVATDVEQFAQAASSQDPEGWRRALGLVRGRPFEGLYLSDWAVLDGTQAEVERLVAKVAVHVTEQLLSQGRAADAEWAIRQALRACPYDDHLHLALLAALEAQGHFGAMRSAQASYLRMSQAISPVTRGDPVRL